MATIMRIITLSILAILVMFSVTNCSSPAPPPDDYSKIKSDLQNAESQLAILQGKLAEAASLETKYQSLKNTSDELQKQIDASNKELQEIVEDFDELNTKYEQLKGQYDNVALGSVVLNEDEINQAIFTLINRERKNNGLAELKWGAKLYGKCLQNSSDMAKTGELKYYEESLYIAQEVFMAAKYGTEEQLADAALVIWKNNDFRYRHNIIVGTHIYGAVGTYIASDIYYVTFMSSSMDF